MTTSPPANGNPIDSESVSASTPCAFAHREVTRNVLLVLQRPHWALVDPWEINNGLCEDFAEEVLELVEKNWPGRGITPELAVTIVHTELVFGNDTSLAGHVWLVCEQRHFDAECPWGVSDPRDLPIFARFLARKNKASFDAEAPIAVLGVAP